MFSQTIFSINYYLSKPEIGLDECYSEFRCAELKQVPVLRIFGSTLEGQKSCLHIHNVFPYFLIKLNKTILTRSELDKYLFDFANQIEHVLNAALCIRDHINSQHVYKIEPVMTKSMYGYHDRDSIFLKISLINPDIVRKLSELLLNGNIMNESFQPYESHVPYNLQFLIDHNLFGMNLIYLDAVKFRRDSPDLDENLSNAVPEYFTDSSGESRKWNVSNMCEDQLLGVDIARQSTCELELDASASDILNAHMDKDGFMLNPGLSALWEEEKRRREFLSMNVPMEVADLEERPNVLTVENENEFKKRLISLLETRFKETYPFKVDEIGGASEEEAANDTKFYCEAPEASIDESILNILDELHNNSDLDSSMLHATQLNEEDREEILKENLQMTQVQAKTPDKEKEHSSLESSLDDLNKSNNSSSSSSSSCNTSIQEEPAAKKPNLTLLEELINSSEDEKVNEPKCVNAERKVTEKLSASVDFTHNCSYFESQERPSACTHSESISQSFCIRCDHVSEIKDSLNYMAFVSPVKTDGLELVDEKKWSDLLKFDSPTISQAAEAETSHLNQSVSIIDETVTDKTILEDVTQSAEMQASYTRSQSQSSKSMISEMSIYWSDSDDSVKEDHFLQKESRNELKRRRALETIDFTSEPTEDEEISNKIRGRMSKVIGTGEGWFCPRIAPPLMSEMDGDFVASNEPIVQFFKKDKKFKMKLNVPRFIDSVHEEFETLDFNTEEYYGPLDSTYDGNASCWFTPAISLPSARRIRQTLRNKQSLKEKKKLDKQKTTEKNPTTSSTQKTTTDQAAKPSILCKLETDSQQINNEKKRKRKSVRFNETTIFHNEAGTTEIKTAPAAEKGHFQVSDYFTDPCDTLGDNIQIAKKQRNNSQLDETLLDSTSNDSQSRHSFYEYDSILFPIASKFVDFLSATQNDTSLAGVEKDETKEAKKDKKIVASDKTKHETQTAHLTLMSMELHVNTRGDLQPNPETDTIRFICYTVYNQRPSNQNLFDDSLFESHLLVFDNEKRSLATRRFLGTDTKSFMQNRFKSVDYVYKEEDLFESITRAILFHDPDILVGFEIQKLSWCYLCRRAMTLNLNEFCNRISRLPKRKRESVMRIVIDRKKNINTSGKQATGTCEVVAFPQDLHIAGRVVLNLWRVLKSEVALNSYTLENCCFHILKERTAKYGYAELNSWFEHRSDLYRWRTIEYYLYRAQANLKLMGRLDLVGKTTEFAKVYGIEFYHVISRGSQYRVESMMLRIARKLNFIALSASQKQKAQMRAAECIPLTLEPESKFYTDPVAVLDYQSLYPSVIIAFNICFTTCLGRVDLIGKEGCFKFGCSSLFLPDKLLRSLDLEKDIYIAPNGVAFVKSHIRKGILPIMLEDILKTRVMVKNSMKLHKDDNLYKIFDSRQMSLKLIANVTFGYTAANFSGRMPCVEVGDSIVRVARQSLEMSIKYIHDNCAVYRGRVVYGDTDSLFVLFDKIKKQDAFSLSYKVVDIISSFFPKPLKLKFEKIYQPSILLAKKRYIGYMFETPEQSEGVLDAKGVEIVRRDGCPIASKILERSCKILFEFKDPGKVRDYVVKQCTKLVNGKINIKECVIAKEYRGRDNYSNAKSIASCQVANRATAKDPMAEPLISERVPYVIIYGSPNRPLFELVRSPMDLIQNQELKLNYEYYVMKQILPPVDRIMVLLGVNAFEWVKNLSFKPKIYQFAKDSKQTSAGVSLSNYIFLTDCVLCGCKLPSSNSSYKLCNKCKNLGQLAHTKLRYNFQKSEKKFISLIKTCQVCTGTASSTGLARTECISIDCPNNLLILNAGQELQKTEYTRNIIDEYF